ncbi:hypothetical protein NMG60_11037063 [Bertholletia excelsa]
MALSLLKLTTILSLATALLFTFVWQTALSFPLEDSDEPEEYILDDPFPQTPLTSRFLASVKEKSVTRIKKGTHCDVIKNNVCPGVWANNGTSHLYCCKTHCRNVLGDVNNCGVCGHKCPFPQRCCNGVCTDLISNPKHCGKCNRACSPGLRCEFGICGYA